jgi:hypothetical protein
LGKTFERDCPGWGVTHVNNWVPLVSFGVVTLDPGNYVIEAFIRNPDSPGEVTIWTAGMIIEIYPE